MCFFHLTRSSVCRTLGWLLVLNAVVQAGDWPQILGPQRNGQASQESLASEWQNPQPQRQWSYAVGQGYAGPAVVGNQLFVFHRDRREDVLSCLHARTGAELWTARWPARYAGGVDADQGPRCVPVVHDGHVYVYGAAGELHCVSTEGKSLWSRRLAKEYGARDGYFGAGSVPLVMGGMVLVNVGGDSSSSIVALDAKTGETRWKAFDDAASYSSPVAFGSGPQATALFITRYHFVGLDAKGKVLYSYPFGKRGPTVNAASPIVVDRQHFFLTASYGIGAKLVRHAGGKLQVVWESDEALSSQYPTPVLVDQFLYGVHGREDGGPAELRCVEVATGKVRWREPGVGMAHVIVADGKLLVQRTSGELRMVAADSAGYQELGRVTTAEKTARAQPALAGGWWYVRDVAGQLTAWKLPAR